jgi:hypothetical protein
MLVCRNFLQTDDLEETFVILFDELVVHEENIERTEVLSRCKKLLKLFSGF